MCPPSFRTCLSCCRANRRWSISSRPRTASTTGCARARPHSSQSTRNRYGLSFTWSKLIGESLVWFNYCFYKTFVLIFSSLLYWRVFNQNPGIFITILDCNLQYILLLDWSSFSSFSLNENKTSIKIYIYYETNYHLETLHTSDHVGFTFQVDRMQALSAIVDRLNQEYPHTQPTLRRVTLNLSSKVAADESV